MAIAANPAAAIYCGQLAATLNAARCHHIVAKRSCLAPLNSTAWLPATTPKDRPTSWHSVCRVPSISIGSAICSTAKTQTNADSSIGAAYSLVEKPNNFGTQDGKPLINGTTTNSDGTRYYTMAQHILIRAPKLLSLAL